MGFIEALDMEIYRLRQAKETCEFLLYDKKEDRMNFYSQNRLKGVLKNEIKRKGFKPKFLAMYRSTYDISQSEPVKVNDAINHIIEDDLILLDDVSFKPIPDKIFKQYGKVYFNSYCEPETLNREVYLKDDGYSFAQLKIDAPHIIILMNNLHNNDDLAIKDTLLKIADKIQFPAEKAQDCILFYPGEGAGKGIFYKHILQAIFGNYTKKILMNKLKNDFNAYLPQNLILVLEEGKRTQDLIETTKEMITESNLLINEKGKSQTMEDVYFLVFLFSNHMNPADLGKRRGSYHQCNSLGVSVEKSQEVGALLCEEIPKEVKYLLYYLHNLEFKHSQALMPFNTLAKAQVNDLNKNPMELFYDYVIQFPNLQNCLSDLHKRKNNHLDFNWLEINDSNNLKYITKDTFRTAYNMFCELEGFRNNLIQHNKDIVQLWALLQIKATDHKRITIRDGENAGRKLDHIKLNSINESLSRVYKNE